MQRTSSRLQKLHVGWTSRSGVVERERWPAQESGDPAVFSRGRDQRLPPPLPPSESELLRCFGSRSLAHRGRHSSIHELPTHALSTPT